MNRGPSPGCMVKKKVTHLRWFSVLSVPALKSNSICLCSAWVRKTAKKYVILSAILPWWKKSMILESRHCIIFLKNMPYPVMELFSWGPEGSHWHQTSIAWSHCVLLNISKCHCQRSALIIPLWHNSNSACEGLRRVSHWMVDQLPSRYVTSSSTWNRQKSRCCKRIQGQWVNHYIYILSIDMISLWFCHCQPRFPKNKAELGWACSWHIHQHLVLNSDTEKTLLQVSIYFGKCPNSPKGALY